MNSLESNQSTASSRALRWALLVAFCLQLFSWSSLEGYQLADSVEYMERARNLAIGQEVRVDGAVRSFGFSLLITPVFWLASLFGGESWSGLVWIVRLVQMGVGLCLIAQCARLAERVTGSQIGWAVALLIGCNPVFLQYTVSPVSGMAAGLFLALALNQLIERRSQRATFRGGLWLGAALLMAYQTLLPTLAIFGILLLRDRWRHKGHLFACAGGFGVGVLTQIGIDRLTWGEWGLSLTNYIVENVGAILVRILVEVGMIDLAAKIYHIMERALEFQREVTNDEAAASGIDATDLQSPLYYLLELPQMIVWPAIGLAALGLARCITRPSWSRTLPALTLLVSAVVMSLKGAKSFRLWLPLLPMIAVLFALGWDGLLRAVSQQSRRFAAALGASALLAIGALGIEVFNQANTRVFGSYWVAMERVNELAAEELKSIDPGPEPDEDEPGAEYWGMRTVASAYHWAVFLRQDPKVALVKLPHHFSAWDSMDPEEREVLLSSISHQHWLLLHEPLLQVAPEITDRIARDFELETAFWDRDSHPDMGAVLVLKRRQGSPKRPFAVVMDEQFQPERWRREAGLQRTLEEPIDFVSETGPDGSSAERLTLLGWSWETLPESGFGWLNCHWSTDTGFETDYTVVTRITTWDGKHAWQSNSSVLRRIWPLTQWSTDLVYSEAHLVHLGEEPFQAEFIPMGGPWRRGDLMPAKLWIQVVELERDATGEPLLIDGSPVVKRRLTPCRPGEDAPFDLSDAITLQGDRLLTSDGWWFSPDRLLRVGGFIARIRDEDRWPDDGSPDPE